MTIYRVAAVALALVMSTNTSAELCDDAEWGTYLSNICWLTERMTDSELKVTDIEERECVVHVETANLPLIPMGRIVSHDKTTIFFGRSNGRYLVYHERGKGICWKLHGKEISKRSSAIMDQSGQLRSHGPYRPQNQIVLCGPSSLSTEESIEKALQSLYTKYCSVTESEF